MITWLHRALIWVFKTASGRVKIASKVEGKISVHHCLLLTPNSVMLSLILLPFSSYQNKSCYFNFVRRTLACPWGRPTERLKFARRSKILSRCEITSALAMWLDWQILSVIAPYQNRLVASADRPLQTLELFSAHARLYNAAASPASRLRSAGSLAITHWVRNFYNFGKIGYTYWYSLLKFNWK